MNDADFLEAIDADPLFRDSYLIYADWLDDAGRHDEADAQRRASYTQPLQLREDDLVLRSAYAEWLESRGEYEEANRQRQWPAAKQWMEAFAASMPDEGYDDDVREFLTYRKLMQLVQPMSHADAGGQRFVSFGSQESAMYMIYEQFNEFLDHWSILTGIPLPPAEREQIGFRCAC